MSEWVSVKDSLPETEGIYITLEIYNEKMVILFDKGGYIPGADEICGCYFDGAYFESIINGSSYPVETITHWMPLPLPEPPDE